MNYEKSCNGCYSNICDYGANGVVQGIIAPKPATIQPKIYCCLNNQYFSKTGFYGDCTSKNCCIKKKW